MKCKTCEYKAQCNYVNEGTLECDSYKHSDLVEVPRNQRIIGDQIENLVIGDDAGAHLEVKLANGTWYKITVEVLKNCLEHFTFEDLGGRLCNPEKI